MKNLEGESPAERAIETWREIGFSPAQIKGFIRAGEHLQRYPSPFPRHTPPNATHLDIEMERILHRQAAARVAGLEEIPTPPSTLRSPHLSSTLTKAPRSNSEVLASTEIDERFQALGIDIEHELATWKNFYETSGYGTKVEEKSGKKPYQLDLPLLTHGNMEAFEKAFRAGRVNALMIDDNRLLAGETFLASITSPGFSDIQNAAELNGMVTFSQAALGRIKAAYEKEKSLDDLKNAIEREYDNAIRLNSRRVRLIAYQDDASRIYTKEGGHSFIQQIPQKPYEALMDLGTIQRLCSFLAQTEGAITRLSECDLTKKEGAQGRSAIIMHANSFSRKKFGKAQFKEGKLVLGTWDVLSCIRANPRNTCFTTISSEAD